MTTSGALCEVQYVIYSEELENKDTTDAPK